MKIAEAIELTLMLRFSILKENITITGDIDGMTVRIIDNPGLDHEAVEEVLPTCVKHTEWVNEINREDSHEERI